MARNQNGQEPSNAAGTPPYASMHLNYNLPYRNLHTEKQAKQQIGPTSAAAIPPADRTCIAQVLPAAAAPKAAVAARCPPPAPDATAVPAPWPSSSRRSRLRMEGSSWEAPLVAAAAIRPSKGRTAALVAGSRTRRASTAAAPARTCCMSTRLRTRGWGGGRECVERAERGAAQRRVLPAGAPAPRRPASLAGLPSSARRPNPPRPAPPCPPPVRTCTTAA
jgi:hypothetical protein